MKRFFTISTFLIAFFALSMSSFSQLKIGIVDTETIIKEMPEAKKADNDLKTLGQKYQDTLLTMQNELQERLQQYQKQKGMMPADKQQAEEEALQALQMQMYQYNDEKFGNAGELTILREKYLEPIRQKIRVAIDNVAKTEKINLVLDKTSPSLLYAEDKFDITFRVLDEIKRGSAGGK